MRPADTSPEAWEFYLDLNRRMSPGEKLTKTFELSEKAREAALEAVRRRYPEAGEREVFLRFAQSKLGEDLFRRVYGDELPADPPGTPPAFDLERVQDEVMRLEIDRLYRESRRAEQH